MVSPPGVKATFLEFDFLEAFDFISKEADHLVLGDAWERSIADAVIACHSEERTSLVPAYQFAFRFLDVLWGLIFGRTAGPSPWSEWRAETPSGEDKKRTVNVKYLHQRVERHLDTAEGAVQNELRRFTPTVMSVPTLLVGGASAGPSKRPALSDTESLPRYIKRQRVTKTESSDELEF
ncbi:hypothetical protein F4818DRAFT_399032 [Hypoxylon cercidicola]|nr:hypothetical protein F4818DRAFT_399032 [Hypoxylon cercidicola]